MALLWFGIACATKTPFRARVDAVHLGDVAIWPLGFLEMLFKRANRMVISAHGSDVSLATRNGWRATLYRSYLRLGSQLLPNAMVIANSSYVADLARSFGFKKVTIVPMGTDLAASGRPKRSGLLFAGRVSRAKGLRFLVTEVLPLLPASTLLRVAGPVWEESERDLLRHPQVDYLGVLSHGALADEFSRAKITLIPSQVEEGFGLVAIEAAACGSQVVASDAGGLREVVRAPWGELVARDDAAAWAAAIEHHMALGLDALEAISQAARDDIDQNFRWNVAADQTIAHYLR